VARARAQPGLQVEVERVGDHAEQAPSASRSSTQWRASACASGSRSKAGCWPASRRLHHRQPNGSASGAATWRGSWPDSVSCSSSTSARCDWRLWCARARQQRGDRGAS
jgi:hypothetical protein